MHYFVVIGTPSHPQGKKAGLVYFLVHYLKLVM